MYLPTNMEFQKRAICKIEHFFGRIGQIERNKNRGT